MSDSVTFTPYPGTGSGSQAPFSGSVIAPPGSNANLANAVQGVTGGVPIAVTSGVFAPKALDASSIVNGGTAVAAIVGPCNGGFITNPATPDDQGIAAAELLYVNAVEVPGSTPGSANGTTTSLDLGQTWTTGPIPAGVIVWVNAATTGHKFSGNKS